MLMVILTGMVLRGSGDDDDSNDGDGGGIAVVQEEVALVDEVRGDIDIKALLL